VWKYDLYLFTATIYIFVYTVFMYFFVLTKLSIVVNRYSYINYLADQHINKKHLLIYQCQLGQLCT